MRDQVSMVLQKNVLFSGTIYDNIRWGDEHAVMKKFGGSVSWHRQMDSSVSSRMATIQRSYRVVTTYPVDRNSVCVLQERY